MYIIGGGLLPFINVIEAYNELMSMKLVNSKNNRKVIINAINFDINEEVISQTIGLLLEWNKWKRVTKVEDKANMNHFFKENEEIILLIGGFNRENLQGPWNDVFYLIMNYLSLDDLYKVVYYYHFPHLDHFFYHDKISFPFFLLCDLEASFMDVRKCEEEG